MERCSIIVERRFGERARFIFEPSFLNQAQARNIGMRAANTRLAVLLDDDVLVRRAIATSSGSGASTLPSRGASRPFSSTTTGSSASSLVSFPRQRPCASNGR